RPGVNRVKLAAAAGRGRRPCPPCPPLSKKRRRGRRGAARNPSDSDPFVVSGRQDSNLRPLGPAAGPGASSASTDVQVLVTTQGVEGGPGQTACPGRSGTLGRVPPVSPTFRHGLGAHTKREPLLTCKALAARLRVSRATVYALCDRGELPHRRVSNAIRLRVEDLEAFTRRGRP